MKVLDEHTKFAHLGKPGSIFSKGFQRRLNIITKLVDFNEKKILDLGCGEGVWLNAFTKFTDRSNVFGSEYDKEQVDMLKTSADTPVPAENIVNCAGEALTFQDDFFDIVFMNEVLEHVQDDVKTLSEAIRVIKPQGNVVFFTPNRGWPFEQHGMFLNGKYYWGNIPLLPWMPKSIYKKFAPHVRVYSNGELERKIFEAAKLSTGSDNSVKIIYHSHIFPGFDGAVRRLGILGKLIQKFFFIIEKTPLNWFGISHIFVITKTA